MQRGISGLRDKLMIGCALIAACVMAVPAALAHDRYGYRGGSRDSDVLGALVVGAVIGGVLVAATQHHHDYDDGYAYYGGPAYGGGYYPAYGSVNLNVYSSRGYGYHGPRGYYHGNHGYDGYRGYRDHPGYGGYRQPAGGGQRGGY